MRRIRECPSARGPVDGRRLALVSLCLATALGGCAGAHAQASASPAPHIDTVAAKTGRVSPTMRISGVVAPHRQIGIATALNEPIREIRVREGDRVTAGQVLAVLRSDDLTAQLASAEQTAAEGQARSAQQSQQSLLNGANYTSQVVGARAALSQAELALRSALTDRARYLQLYRDGFVSQQILAQQNVVAEQNRQAVASARALLKQAEQTAQVGTSAGGLEASQVSAARAAAASATMTVEGFRRQVDRATIVSPTDGVVAAINANVGEYPSGRQLFTLHDDTAKYAMLAASASEAVRVRPGQPVTLLVANGSTSVPGHVEALLDQLAPGSTNYTVKVQLARSKATVLSGMPVIGVVRLAPVEGVVIPNSAFTDTMRTAVFVVSGGKAHERKVSAVAQDGSRSVVRGIPVGARVVADAQNGVGDGDEVRE